ncbi:arginine--tRNA ligase [Patescibacteria group bacterium]|nr:arginine--tRNA ligase [Patescibacteria group bacterium]
MLFSRISEIVSEALPEKVDFTLETPPEKKFGDLACNAAMLLANKLKKQPRELAKDISEKLSKNNFIAKVEIAGPGFLNIFLAPAIFHETFLAIEKAGSELGKIKKTKKEKVNLEFISANPTGPLTIANGRGGFGGDVLARVLERAGFEVTREFYVNDAGKQIELFGKSILAAVGKIETAEDFYQGDYIDELAKKYPEKISKNAVKTGKRFAEIMLETEIKPSTEKMGIKFDEWFSEAKLREEGGVEETLEFLKSKNLTYKEQGAVWLRTSDFGDDKDRVIVKSGGELTYALPDLMYHKNKFERGFTKLIDILGADHHGYVPRLKAGVKMLGFGEVEVIITQLVKLFREGKEVRMSKRAGDFELMDDLIREVGADVARWFFVMRDWNTHLNFDLDLAKKQSSDNPVFYVQYAHTRLASILVKAGEVDWKNGNLQLLEKLEEFDLIKKMSELPDLIEEISKSYAINTLTTFARELAETFHRFYENCRVIDSENPELTKARLRLTAAAKEVLRIVLEDLVGVSAPEKM